MSKASDKFLADDLCTIFRFNRVSFGHVAPYLLDRLGFDCFNRLDNGEDPLICMLCRMNVPHFTLRMMAQMDDTAIARCDIVGQTAVDQLLLVMSRDSHEEDLFRANILLVKRLISRIGVHIVLSASSHFKRSSDMVEPALRHYGMTVADLLPVYPKSASR